MYDDFVYSIAIIGKFDLTKVNPYLALMGNKLSIVDTSIVDTLEKIACIIKEGIALYWQCASSVCTFGWWDSIQYIDGLVQDCSISIANAMEILQSCTKSSIRTYGKVGELRMAS